MTESCTRLFVKWTCCCLVVNMSCFDLLLRYLISFWCDIILFQCNWPLNMIGTIPYVKQLVTHCFSFSGHVWFWLAPTQIRPRVSFGQTMVRYARSLKNGGNVLRIFSFLWKINLHHRQIWLFSQTRIKRNNAHTFDYSDARGISNGASLDNEDPTIFKRPLF